MSVNYGMPYMGSKAKVIKSIALNFPPADNFYDLFAGGGSVTHYMTEKKSHKYKNFYYNEIIKDVMQLFKDAVFGKYSYKNFKPEWISKEKFDKEKDTNAYIRLIWSFGNNQKYYLFSGKIEPYKRSLHQAIVFDEFDETAKNALRLEKWSKNISTIKSKRLYFRQIIKHTRQLQQLEQLIRLERLQQLEQLERLQQLERLEQLERLDFSSKSYEQMQIKKNSVVYCDIPYKNKRGYLSEFNHKQFFDWAATRPFPVFISEYNLDDSRFKLVYKIRKNSLLDSQKSDRKEMIEKLYWNGVSIDKL